MTHKSYSFVKCQTQWDKQGRKKEKAMFTRLASLLQLRVSTAFLLERADDRLLDDIGLTRADLRAMHLGLPTVPVARRGLERPAGRALPVFG